MTAVSDRIGIKELCIETLRAHFAGTSGFDAVTAWYDTCGETPTDEMIILGTIGGNSQADAFGPNGSTDEFTIDVVLGTTGHETALEADRRCQLILNEVNDALFTSGFARQTFGAICFPGKQDGPNGVPPYDGNLAESVVEMTIGCRVSLRGS